MLTLEHLAQLLADHPGLQKLKVAEFALGSKHFAFNSRPSIMGVINLSPDSCTRESVCLNSDQAVQRGLVLAAQGADIVDLGAESTLPHAARVDPAAQQKNLLPVVRALSDAGVIVSVETYAPATARACLEAGASVLNLTGGLDDDEIFRLAAAHSAAVILCHVQGPNVRAVGDFDFSGDLLAAMREYFSRAADRAGRCGAFKILLDPGLGFYYKNLLDSAARVRHQMRVFLETFRLRSLGFPVCHALPHAFEFFGEEVRAAEPFFAVLAALGRTDLFRTHEVPRVRAVLQTLNCY